MNIGIDIDDTISNTIEITLPRAKKYAQDFLGMDISNINFSQAIDHMYIEKVFNLSKEQMHDFWEKNLLQLVQGVKIKDNAAKIINKLKDEGHRIVIVTARWNECNFDAMKESEKWLKENGVMYDKLYVNADSKVEIAKNENIDLFIDDSIKNCRELSQNNIKCYLFKSAVNKNIEESNRFEIVESWDQIYKKITKGGK